MLGRADSPKPWVRYLTLIPLGEGSALFCGNRSPLTPQRLLKISRVVNSEVALEVKGRSATTLAVDPPVIRNVERLPAGDAP